MLVFKLGKLNPIQCHTAPSARQGWAFAGKRKWSGTALMYEMKEMMARSNHIAVRLNRSESTEIRKCKMTQQDIVKEFALNKHSRLFKGWS
jgi:hypothetical protein